MNKGYSPEIRAAAVALVKRGLSLRQAAAQVTKQFKTKRPITEAGVRRWVKDDAAAAARRSEELDAALDAEDAAPDSAPAQAPQAIQPEALSEVPTDETASAESLRDQIRRMLRNAQALGRRAEADGNTAAAQKAQRDALGFAAVLARLEVAERSAGDGVTFTRAEIEAAEREIDATVAAYVADAERCGGIVCAECGRRLRIAIAKGER